MSRVSNRLFDNIVAFLSQVEGLVDVPTAPQLPKDPSHQDPASLLPPVPIDHHQLDVEDSGAAAAINNLHSADRGGGSGAEASGGGASAAAGLLKWNATYRDNCITASIDGEDDTRSRVVAAGEDTNKIVSTLEGAIAAVAPDVKVIVSFSPISDAEASIDAPPKAVPTTPSWGSKEVLDGLLKSPSTTTTVSDAVARIVQAASSPFTVNGVAIGVSPAREEASVLRAEQLVRALSTQLASNSSTKGWDELYGSSGVLLDAVFELMGASCGVFSVLDRDIKTTSELLYNKWFQPLAMALSSTATTSSSSSVGTGFNAAFPLKASVTVAAAALSASLESSDSQAVVAQTLLVASFAVLLLLAPNEEIIEKREEKKKDDDDGTTPTTATPDTTSTTTTTTTATTTDADKKKPVIREFTVLKPLLEGCASSEEWAVLIHAISKLVASSAKAASSISATPNPVAPISKDVYIRSFATVKDAEKPKVDPKKKKADSKKPGISPQKRKDDLRNARKSRIPIYVPRGCTSITLTAHDSLTTPMQVTLCGCSREQEASKLNKMTKASASEQQSDATKKWSVFERSTREGISRTFSCHLSSRTLVFDNLDVSYTSRNVVMLSVPVDCTGSFTVTCAYSSHASPATSWPLAAQALGSASLQLAARAAWRALLQIQQASTTTATTTTANDDNAKEDTSALLSRKGVMGLLACGPSESNTDVATTTPTLTPIDSSKLKMMFAQCRAAKSSPWRAVIVELVNTLEFVCGELASAESMGIVGRRWLFDWLPSIQGEINLPAKDNLLAICQFCRDNLQAGGAANAGPAAVLEALLQVSAAGITADQLQRVLAAVTARANFVNIVISSVGDVAGRGGITPFAAAHSLEPLFHLAADFNSIFVGANQHARTAMGDSVNNILEMLAVTTIGRGLLGRILESQVPDALPTIASLNAVWPRLVADAQSPSSVFAVPTTISSSDRGVRVATDARGALNTHCKTMGMIELRGSTPWEPSVLLKTPIGSSAPLYYFEATVQDASVKNFAIGLIPTDKLAIKEPEAISFSVENLLHSMHTFNKRLWDMAVRKGDVVGCGLRNVKGFTAGPEDHDVAGLEVYFTLNGRLLVTETLAKKEVKKSRRQLVCEAALSSISSSASLKSTASSSSAAPSTTASTTNTTTTTSETIENGMYKFLTPVVSAETINTATFVLNFGQAPFVYSGHHEGNAASAVSASVIQRALSVLSTTASNVAAPATEATKTALLRALLPVCVASAVEALQGANSQVATRACADLRGLIGAWKGALLQEQDGDLEGTGFSPVALLETLVASLTKAVISTNTATNTYNGATPLLSDIIDMVIAVAAEDGDAEAIMERLPLEDLSTYLAGSLVRSSSAPRLASERTYFPSWESTSSAEHTVIRGNAVQLDDESMVTLALGSPLPTASSVSFSLVFRRNITSKSFLLLIGSLYVGVTSDSTLPASLTSWKNGSTTWALHEVPDDQLPGAHIAPRTDGIPIFTVGSVITVTVDRVAGTLSFNSGGEVLATVFRDIPADVELRPFVQLVGEHCTAFLLPSTYSVATPELPLSLKRRDETALTRQLLTLKATATPLANALTGALSDTKADSVVIQQVMSVLGAEPDLKHLSHQGTAPVELLYPVTYNQPQSNPSSVMDKDGVSLTATCYDGGLWKIRQADGTTCDAPSFHLFPPSTFIGPTPFRLQDASVVAHAPLSTLCTTEGLEAVATTLVRLMSTWETTHLISGTLFREERVARLKIEDDAMKALYSKLGPIPPALMEELFSRNYALNEPVIQPTTVPPVMTFSQNDAHQDMIFPMHYRGSLVLSPSHVRPDNGKGGSQHPHGPYAAVTNEPVPATGSFDVRLVIEGDWLGLLPQQFVNLSGACYIGLCTNAYRADVRDHQRASLTSNTTDMWAIPHTSTPKLQPKHSSVAPLSVRNFNAGQTIRMHINREKGTIELFIKAKSNTEVRKGIFYTNLPKGVALYPFVQLPRARHCALILPEKGSLPRAVHNKMSVAGSVTHDPDKVGCSGCARDGGEGENLKPPNWYRCNECSKFDLCTVCMNNHVHPGHTFTQMRSASFAPSHILSDDAEYVSKQLAAAAKNKAFPITTSEVPAVPAIIEHLSTGSYVCSAESDLTVKVSADDKGATPLVRWALLRASTTLARTTAEVAFNIKSNAKAAATAPLVPLDAIIGIGTRDTLDKLTTFEELRAEMGKPLRPGAYPTFIALDTADIGSSQQQHQNFESARDDLDNATPLSHLYRAMKPSATTSDFITLTVSNNNISLAVSGQHVSTTTVSMGGSQLVLVVAFNPDGNQGHGASQEVEDEGTVVTVRNPLASVSLGKVSERHDNTVRLAASAQSRWVTRSQLREPIVLVGAISYLYEGLRCFITANARSAKTSASSAFIPVVITSTAKVDNDIVKVHDGTTEQEYPARGVWVLAKDNNDKLGEGEHFYPTEKRRLRAFYKKYAPEKTEAEMDTAIDKFSESTVGLDGMFKALIKKYGPEPAIVIEVPQSAFNDEEDDDGVKVPISAVENLLQLLVAANGVVTGCAVAGKQLHGIYGGKGGLQNTLASLVRTFGGNSSSGHSLPAALNTLWLVTHPVPSTATNTKTTDAMMKLAPTADNQSTKWEVPSNDTTSAMPNGDLQRVRLHSVTAQVSLEMDYSVTAGTATLVVGGGRLKIGEGILKPVTTTSTSQIQNIVFGIDTKNADAVGALGKLEGIISEKSISRTRRGLPDDTTTKDGALTVALQLKIDTNNGSVSWWTARGNRGFGAVINIKTNRPVNRDRIKPSSNGSLSTALHATGTKETTDTIVEYATAWHTDARDACVTAMLGLRRAFVSSGSDQFEALDAAFASDPIKEVSAYVGAYAASSEAFMVALHRLSIQDPSVAPAFLTAAASLKKTGNAPLPVTAVIAVLNRWWLRPTVIRCAKPFLDAAYAANKEEVVGALSPLLTHFDTLFRGGYRSRELFSAVLDTFADIVFDGKDTSVAGRSLPYHLVPLIVDVGASLQSKAALPACTTNAASLAQWQPLCAWDAKDEKAPEIKVAGGGLIKGALRTSAPLNEVDPTTTKFYFEAVQPQDSRILVGVVDQATLDTNQANKEMLSLVAFDGVNVERKARCSRHSWFTAPSTDDIIGCAVDLEAGTITFSVNNTTCHPSINIPKGSKLYAYVAMESGAKPLELSDTRRSVQYLPNAHTPIFEAVEVKKRTMEPYSSTKRAHVVDSKEDVSPSAAQLAYIEQTVRDLLPFVDMGSRQSMAATAVASLKSVLSTDFREKVMATPAPLRQITPTRMGGMDLKTVSVKWYTLFSAAPRTPHEALQHSVLAQLYQQLPKIARSAPGGGKSGGVVDATFMDQTPMFTTALSVTDSGHMPIDAGGPYKQVWSLLSEELMVVDNTDKPDFHRNPMFVQSLASKAKVMVPNRLLGVASEGQPGFEPYVASLFNLLGMIMGHMARAKFPIGLDLSPFLWKFVVEDPITVEDYLSDVDGHLKDMLLDTALLSDDEEAAEIFPGFLARLAEMKRDGAGADDIATRKEAASWCIVHMLDKQLLPLRNGLQRVLGRDVVMSLDWRALEMMVCGEPHPSFEQVKASINCSLPEPHATMFWKALEGLTPEDWGKFFFFCSSQRRFPLNRKIGVFPDPRSTPNHLPVASTCFSQVRIPLYPTQEAWTAKLKEAIECQQMELA